MKLTKEQKIEAYEGVLNKLENGRRFTVYICDHLFRYLANRSLDSRSRSLTEEIRMYFPEFSRRKTKYGMINLGWWPENDIQSRIDVIKDIIEKLKR